MMQSRTLLALSACFCLVSSATSQTVVSPPVNAAAAARFLEQAGWGPNAESIQKVQQLGYSKWLDIQFTQAASPYPALTPDAKGNTPIGPLQQAFFANAYQGQDQLRQRVAFALSEIWVVSGVKLNKGEEILPYLRLLSSDAFANYSQIMYDVTLSPAMGHYLDMVNNDKPNPKLGNGADENYAREIMQLFTIGVSLLNEDGSYQTDSQGQPIPAYNQDQIEGFADAFTGWTYAPLAGAPSHTHNPANFDAPMVAVESNHDMGTKELLNRTILPANQTAEVDIKAALQNIFQHANVGPFIGRQLIQHLVTSSPSPAYVTRVARVFANNGSGVRGDMKAVIKAILLDPEARLGDSTAPVATEGHLREPVLYISSLLRALSVPVLADNSLAGSSNSMGQNLFYSPTVFNYFPPNYEIGGTTINAPEFGILTTATAMPRVDFLNSLVFGGTVGGVKFDITPWTTLAATPDKLVDTVGALLLHGQMSTAMRTSVLKAVTAATTPKAKAQTAIYLIASSSQYQVER